MTDRITITPRVVDAQEVASIVSLVQLGRVPEAWERFQAASTGDGALARLGGAINAALTQAAPEIYTLPDWGTDERGNRRVRMTPGTVYAIRLVVPLPPVRDAAPLVRASAAIVPAGAGDVRAGIVEDLAQVPPGFTAAPPATSGGAATQDWDYAPLAGRVLYAVFALGPAQAPTDVNLLVQLPTRV